MNPFWLTFEDGTTACCEGAEPLHAKEIAELSTGKRVATIRRLPYPATPRIRMLDDTSEQEPAFCPQTDPCAGRSTCPRERACND